MIALLCIVMVLGQVGLLSNCMECETSAWELTQELGIILGNPVNHAQYT